MIWYDVSGGYFPTVRLLCKLKGSIIPVGLCVSIPSGLLGVLLVILGVNYDDFHEIVGTDQLKPGQIWTSLTVTLIFLIGFRTNKAYDRFWQGTTLLHQMWGEWFDAVSCLVAFSRPAKKAKPHEVADFRHTLIRLMSLCHASALEEIAEVDHAPTGYHCIDLGGLEQSTLVYLKECKHNKDLNFNRVEVILHMIQNLIVENHDTGVLKIPPPILSRVFQTLSRGQVNLANCKKLVSTLFPFPYAQIVAIGLILFSLGTPCIMASNLQHKGWAFVCSAVPVFGLWTLNYIAAELEIPFGTDPNDLPLDEFQDHMNNSMLMLSRPDADTIPGTCDQCHMEYFSMKDSISNERPTHFINDDKERKRKVEIQGPNHVNEDTFQVGKAAAPVTQSAPVPPVLLHGPTMEHFGPGELREQKASVAAQPPPAVTGNLPTGVQKNIGDLGAQFEDLLNNSARLTTQLMQSIDTVQGFTRQLDQSVGHATRFNTVLGQTTETMLSSSREFTQAAGWCGPPRKASVEMQPCIAIPFRSS